MHRNAVWCTGMMCVARSDVGKKDIGGAEECWESCLGCRGRLYCGEDENAMQAGVEKL